MCNDDDKDLDPFSGEREIDNSSDDEEEEHAEYYEISKEPGRQRRGRNNPIWKYYKAFPEKQVAECLFCDTTLSFKSSTATLKKHLGRKHSLHYEKLYGYKNNYYKKMKLIENRDEKIVVVLKDANNTRSQVWRWFEKVADYKAKCRVCRNVYSFMTSMTNLKTHLRTRHPQHYSKLCDLQDQPSKMETSADVEEEKAHEDSLIETSKCNCECSAGEHSEGCAHASQAISSWDYYEKIEQEIAVCRLCKKNIDWSDNIEDLRSHLEQEHPDHQFNDEDPIQKSGMREKPVPQDPHEVLIEEFLYSDDEIEADNSTEEMSSDRKQKPSQNQLENYKQCKTATDDAEYNDSLDKFGLYTASLLRMLPKEVAARFQVQIVDRLMKERVKFLRDK